MRLGLLVVTTCILPLLLRAQRPAPATASTERDTTKAAPIPNETSSVTDHTIRVGGQLVPYRATAATMLLKNDKDESIGALYYTAYTRTDAKDASQRPLAFIYNGGPGSASAWLHMGALGPRRVVTADAAPTPPPPYQVVDNAWSVLDRTDLVMIDPVGTGLSKAVGDAKDKDFWGAHPDIESVSRFIRQYVSDNGRWNSPKYLLGESYGTTRAGGIVDWLQGRGMSFNGVVLVSVALDLSAIFAYPGNDRPYPFFLPSFAAVSAYHKLLPSAPQDTEAFLAEVRQ